MDAVIQKIQDLMGRIETAVKNNYNGFTEEFQKQIDTALAKGQEAIDLAKKGEIVEAAEVGAEAVGELTVVAGELGLAAA